jgi:NAD(P)H-dependent FMN reductase
MTEELSKPRLGIIVGSVRPGRVASPVSEWIESVARSEGDFDVQVVDLAEIRLPFLDEALHPSQQQYAHQHTRDWSALVESLDAFVVVSPEYNYGFSAPLKNALDYLFFEWNYKPIGIVSYGGVSAGTRSAQMLKLVLDGLRLSPVADNVHIPFVSELVVDGRLEATELMDQAAARMLKELARVESSLRPLRLERQAASS